MIKDSEVNRKSCKSICFRLVCLIRGLQFCFLICQIYLLLLKVLVNLRLVFPRMGRPESMLSLPTLLVLSSLLSVSTRWTLPSLLTVRPGSRKSKRRSLTSSRRSVMTPRPLLSSLFLDGTETTCSRPRLTCPGSADGRLRGRENL